ncbi:MAG: extracellular solute-binding protein [Spirochaetaceae bacterium]|jgi:putative aldouronate transport system substrate-binding protein|nr:extracellular solute-binding protein [Spirochaetaceae bacterium]
MKKTYVRVFTALVCVSAALIFAGCGKKSDAGSGEVVEITVEVFDRGTDGGKSDPTKNNWTDWIQQKVLEDEGIKVTFVPVPRAEENTALNNLMAAGTPPDVCYTYSAELVTMYSELGGLVDLDPYIDTTLKDLKAFLGPDEALPGRDLITRNRNNETGRIYSMPARRMNTARLNLFIRKDWLDILGLPLPTTTEEYFQALTAFKDQDPGNIGKDKVVPFSMTFDTRWTAGSILESFIDPTLSLRDRWVYTVIDRYFFLPGYKEGLRFMNRMYNGGLIDRDFPLYKTEDDQLNLVKAGAVGSVCHNWDNIYREGGILVDLQKNVPGADLVPVDCMTNSEGITKKISYDAAGLNIFIPASAKNPEAAMRYINWLARFENYNFLQLGQEGINHDMVDGVPKLKSATGLWIQNSAQNIDYTIHMNGLDLGDPELTAKALASGYAWPADVIANAYTIAMTNAAPGPVVPVTLTAAAPVMQTLIDKSNNLAAQSITTRAADFDQVWEAGIADLLASGAQSVIDERIAKFVEP